MEYDSEIWPEEIFQPINSLLEELETGGNCKEQKQWADRQSHINQIRKYIEKIKGRLEEMEIINRHLAKVNEELDRRVLELAIIEKASKKMANVFDEDILVNIIFDSINQVTAVESLGYVSHNELTEENIKFCGLNHDNLIGEQDKKRYLQIANDVVIEKRLLTVGNLLAVPLLFEQKVLAVIVLNSTKSLTVDDKRFIKIIISHASLVLANIISFSTLKELSTRDELTGLFNRRFFIYKIKETLKNAVEENKSLSLLFIDLDNFKQYNDNYGHLVGDQVLVNFSQVLKKSTREKDISCRYGGEEFAVLLKGVKKETADKIAERIRQASPECTGTLKTDFKGVTVSIGVATFPEDGHKINLLLNKADQRLYQAKEQGKNRVCL